MVAAVVAACLISVAHGLLHASQVKRLVTPSHTVDLHNSAEDPWRNAWRTLHKFSKDPHGPRTPPTALDQMHHLRVDTDARDDSRPRRHSGTTRSESARRRSTDGPRFYMYEPLPWVHACNTNWTGLHAPQNEVVDVLIHRVLKHHPWRTSNPQKAQLFFVPAYVSLSRVNKCGNHTKNMASTAQMLLKSPHFKQKSKSPNHLIAAFEFGSREDTLGALGALTESLIVCHYENKDFLHPLVVPYAGQLGSETLKLWQRDPGTSWTELSARKHSLFFVGQVDHRKAYRERRIMMLYLPAAFPDSILIRTPRVSGKDHNFTGRWPSRWDPIEFHKELPDCYQHNLKTGCSDQRLFRENYTDLGKQAKFNMVVHGDTPSTSRLYDAFEFGQIPIIISKGFRLIAMPFAQDVAWDDFAVFVHQDDFIANPVASITQAVNRADHKSMFNSLKQARRALDWFTDPNCIGAALLSSAARDYVGLQTLPPAMSSKYCK